MSKERNTTFILIINKEGKFNYSNKGFQNSPHYIAMTTAKYRAKELVDGATRWYNPNEPYSVQRARDLLLIRVRYFRMDNMAQMMLEPAMPDIDLREFADMENMPELVKKIDELKAALAKIK